MTRIRLGRALSASFTPCRHLTSSPSFHSLHHHSLPPSLPPPLPLFSYPNTGPSSSSPLASLPAPPFLSFSPSPFASSSKVTLDDFLNLDHSDPFFAALNYAHEDELVAALTSRSPPRHSSPSSSFSPSISASSSHQSLAQHDRWIEPATAYIGLRSSSLFNHYLYLLLPHISHVYALLRPSGLHHVLVSDLLLRNPDPRALRDCLEADAAVAASSQAPPIARIRKGKDRARMMTRRREAIPAIPRGAEPESNRLRPSVVAQVYAVVQPSLRRRTIPRLSRMTNLSIARVLITSPSSSSIPSPLTESPLHLPLHSSTSSTTTTSTSTASPSITILTLSELYWDIVATTTFTPEGCWRLFELVMHFTHHGPRGDEEALRAVQYLIKIGKIPSSAIGKGSSRDHPRAQAVLVLSVMLRACIGWKLRRRALQVAERLRDVVLEEQRGKMSGVQQISPASQPAIDLLLQSCRVIIARGDSTFQQWVTEMLLDLHPFCFPSSTLSTSTLFTSTSSTGSGTSSDALIHAFTSTLNMHLASLTPSGTARVYTRLPKYLVPAVNPSNVLRIAQGAADAVGTAQGLGGAGTQALQKASEVAVVGGEGGPEAWVVLKRIGENLLAPVANHADSNNSNDVGSRPDFQSIVSHDSLESRVPLVADSFPVTLRAGIVCAFAEAGRFRHLEKLYRRWYGDQTGSQSVSRSSNSCLAPDVIVAVVSALAGPSSSSKHTAVTWHSSSIASSSSPPPFSLSSFKSGPNFSAEDGTVYIREPGPGSSTRRDLARSIVAHFQARSGARREERLGAVVLAQMAMRDHRAVRATMRELLQVEGKSKGKAGMGGSGSDPDERKQGEAKGGDEWAKVDKVDLVEIVEALVKKREEAGDDLRILAWLYASAREAGLNLVADPKKGRMEQAEDAFAVKKKEVKVPKAERVAEGANVRSSISQARMRAKAGRSGMGGKSKGESGSR